MVRVVLRKLDSMSSLEKVSFPASHWLDHEVSTFPNAYNTAPLCTKTVSDVLTSVKNSQWKNKVEEIKVCIANGDLKQAGDLKKKLTAITFSGTFSKRAGDSLLKHSSILCVDLDHLNEHVISVKSKLIDDPHVISVFISPSGTGLKVLVAINATNADQHLACYYATESYLKKYSDTFDESCKDVCRLCFGSYDPDCYIAPKDKLIQYISPQSIPLLSSSLSSSLSTGYRLQDTVYRTPLEPVDHKELALILSDRDRLLKENAKTHPDLVLLYESVLIDKGEIGLHKRNEWLLEMVVFMYHSFSFDMALQLAELHRTIYTELYSGTQNDHGKSFISLWKGVEDNYHTKLSEDELFFYNTLEEPYRSAFRICRDFARRNPTLHFFLGNDHLASRLGPKNHVKGSRFIQRLIKIRVIELVEKGKQRQKGEKRPPASTYKWAVNTTALNNQQEIDNANEQQSA